MKSCKSVDNSIEMHLYPPASFLAFCASREVKAKKRDGRRKVMKDGQGEISLEKC